MVKHDKRGQADLSNRKMCTSDLLPKVFTSIIWFILSIVIAWKVKYVLIFLASCLIILQWVNPGERYFSSKKGYGQR